MCARVSQSRRAPLAHVMAASSASFIQTPLAPALLAGFWAFAERQDLSPSVALRLVVHHVIGRAGFVVEDYDPQAERRCDFQNWARRRCRAQLAHPLSVRVDLQFQRRQLIEEPHAAAQLAGLLQVEVECVRNLIHVVADRSEFPVGLVQRLESRRG